MTKVTADDIREALNPDIEPMPRRMPDPIPFDAPFDDPRWSDRYCCDGRCEKGLHCPQYLPTGEERAICSDDLRRLLDEDYGKSVSNEYGGGGSALAMAAGLVIGGLLGIFGRELVEGLVVPALVAAGVL